MQNPLKSEFAEQQPRVLVPEILNVLEYDALDIIILSKFLKNMCYNVNDLRAELVEEGRIKDMCAEGIRGRLEKYVASGLVSRIRSSVVSYDFNECTAVAVRNLIRRFVVVLGVIEIL